MLALEMMAGLGGLEKEWHLCCLRSISLCDLFLSYSFLSLICNEEVKCCGPGPEPRAQQCLLRAMLMPLLTRTQGSRSAEAGGCFR